MFLGVSLNQKLVLGGSLMGCELERIPSLQIPKCTGGRERVRMLSQARPHPLRERGLGGSGTSMTPSHSGSDCDEKKYPDDSVDAGFQRGGPQEKQAKVREAVVSLKNSRCH